ncbi:MAG TPA: hypothetical protein VNN10_04935 [Dehalococcoidia bacterium]|nr:hypothetical protein [Dehalococcoidia bacterium]
MFNLIEEMMVRDVERELDRRMARRRQLLRDALAEGREPAPGRAARSGGRLSRWLRPANGSRAPGALGEGAQG